MLSKILNAFLILLICWLQYQIWYGTQGQNESVSNDYEAGYRKNSFEQKNITLLQLEIAEQIKQNQQLTSQNKKLKKEIWMLRNKSEILEEKAREKLGLIKDGEIFYRIIPKN